MEALRRARLRRVLGLRRSSAFLVLYVLGYITYLVAGGVVFATLEGPLEYQVRTNLDLTISRFRSRNPTVSDDDLEALIEEVVRASNKGVSVARNVSSEPNWSFGQSIFFSSTVVTTIGYGHVTPLSSGGKIFCILYAMVGIPLTLVLLSALVERLMIPTTLFLQFLTSRLGHLYQPLKIRVLHLLIVATCHICIFLLVPAAVFAQLEPGWDYLDSLYYCFISLTTVGLGDYIPGDSPHQPYRPFYKVAITVYLLVGLTFSMLTLTIFYDIPQLNFGVLFLRRSDEATTNPEKARLQNPGSLDLKYTEQCEDQRMRTKKDKPSLEAGSTPDYVPLP